MTEQEALAAALDRSSGLDQLHPNDAFGAGFHAALAWLRSQGEPVAWARSDTVLGWKDHLMNTALMFPSDKGLANPIPLFLAPQPAIPDGWKPIETAPKDGTRILVYAVTQDDPYDRPNAIAEAWWADEDATRMPRWVSLGLTDWQHPSHWMPIPAAPEPSK